MTTIVAFMAESPMQPQNTNDAHAFWSSDMTDTTITDPTSIGKAIRQTRKAPKITQKDLSLQMGISRTTIRAIEQGKETAHIGLVLQLCRHLGMMIVVGSPITESGS
ncbi:helix-turn-helix domain-containing protein [Sedimentitalea sp.]|uniref:helix-turn-helix domain-containing protein n=1 Tax=Sedimentitalea sp. TaxID=2048915 RepID=UPI00329A10DE